MRFSASNRVLRLEPLIVFEQLIKRNGLKAIKIHAGIQNVLARQQHRSEIHIGVRVDMSVDHI